MKVWYLVFAIVFWAALATDAYAEQNWLFFGFSCWAAGVRTHMLAMAGEVR